MIKLSNKLKHFIYMIVFTIISIFYCVYVKFRERVIKHSISIGYALSLVFVNFSIKDAVFIHLSLSSDLFIFQSIEKEFVFSLEYSIFAQYLDKNFQKSKVCRPKIKQICLPINQVLLFLFKESERVSLPSHLSHY